MFLQVAEKLDDLNHAHGQQKVRWNQSVKVVVSPTTKTTIGFLHPKMEVEPTNAETTNVNCGTSCSRCRLNSVI